MIKHLYRKASQTPAETAQLRADRARYQRDNPTPEQLLAEGGHQEFIPMGELMLLHQVMASLKKERERQQLSLAEVARRTGIDQAALSRLETGSNSNPTLGTICRIALALKKMIVCDLHDAPADKLGRPRQRARA